jgi:hypothetical protein
MKYAKVITEISKQEMIVRDNEDGTVTWIPTDPANPDYQRYLNPEAEQSTPNLAE